MTRLRREWASSLALAAVLLVAVGCGQAEPAAVSQAAPDRAVVDAPRSEGSAALPPRAFAASMQLAPLPSPLPSLIDGVTLPTQAQYAQTANQSLPPVIAPASAPGIRATTQGIYAPQSTPADVPTQRTSPSGTALPRTQSRSSNQPVADQVTAMTRRALDMAQKGMLFAAKNELIQALALVAQALDVQEGGNKHIAALSAGLTALKEADDFSPESGSQPVAVRVADVARGHRTTLLAGAGDVPTVAAQQQYFAFAQQQLALAAGNEPAASQALYTLGRIQTALAGPTSQTQSLHGPRAIVFHQAALAVDARNHLAANELGVLLARYGQLPEARQALLHSVSIQPQVETWQNLAVVHRRLGEIELARLAENERQLLIGQLPAAAMAGPDMIVTWVDAQTFAASGSNEPGWPQPTAAKPPLGKERR